MYMYVLYVYLIMPCQPFCGKLLVFSFLSPTPPGHPTHIILRTVQYIPTLPARPVYILVLHRARSMAYVLRNCPSQCVSRRTRMAHISVLRHTAERTWFLKGEIIVARMIV